jgi:perosamine synthetase
MPINISSKLFIKSKHFLQLLFGRYNINYTGGTTFPSDAWDVYRRWRNREPLLEGPHIQEFEQALSNYYGGLEVVTFGAGRMALYAILKAMNLRDEDEVILPGYTCVVTSNAIRYAGLKPVYVDVSVRDFNMIPELVEKAVTPKTRLILAQHTFGIPCDIEALLDISQRLGVPLIEDGAHAIGARWDGKLLGCYGYASFFSTQGTKMFSTERGGYAVTKDKDLAERVREIQDKAVYESAEIERACLLRWCYRAAFSSRVGLNPRLTLLEYLIRKLRIPGLYRILEYDREQYQCALDGNRPKDYPVRLPNLMAYAGLLQLRRLEKDIAHRRYLAEYLETQLLKFGADIAVYDHKRAQPSWVRFPFIVKDRRDWIIAMNKSRITPGFWLNDPIYPKGADWKKAGYRRGMCPNAEYLSEHILNVPVDRRVSIAHINKFLKVYQKLSSII